MIEDADEDLLISLRRHLRSEPSATGPRVELSFWHENYFRLFMSHRATYRRFASELQAQLLAFGISSFVAHEDIEPTREWQNQIETALETADALVALMHPEFHQSNWTDQEIGYALARHLPVVSVNLGCDPYGFIERFQALDGQDKTATTLARDLFTVLNRNAMTYRRIAYSVVRRFAESESWNEAKINMGLLEKLEYWDSTLSDIAQRAINKNGELRHAFGVPERLGSFIESAQRS